MNAKNSDRRTKRPMKNKKRSMFKALLPFLGPHKKLFVGLVIAELIVSLAQTAVPLFQRYAINIFIGEQTTDGLALFIALYALIIAFQSGIDYIGAFNCCKIEMFVLRDLRRAAFDHLQTLPISFYNRNSVGYLHARMMSDTDNISSTVSWGVYQGTFNGLYIVGATIVMLVISPILALCVLAIVPFIAMIALCFNRILLKLRRKVRETNSVITGSFNEAISGVESAKTLGIEEDLDRKLFKQTMKMRKQSIRLGSRRALVLSIFTFAGSAVLAVVLYIGGQITMRGVMLIGTLSMFMSYAQGITGSVQWLMEFFTDLINVRVNVERIDDLLSTKGEVTDSPEVTEKYGDCFEPKRENWEKLEGDIEFEDVSFKYPDGDEYVLSHFDLKVKKGTNVAIVGETGAGKSTLVNLVCRFFEPTSGRILIDGRDARERSVGWLHGNIGYVLQDPHLFSGTVRENLLYGKPNATDDELIAALECVNAHKFANKHGLDAEVGEGGNTLSVGEKQLVSFARAILVDPAIFILDEATSSVDTLTEKLIQDAIEKLMKGRTSFVIAHRLSTIRNADVILVVDDGKIVERGTHSQLIAKRGAYYKLYTKQFIETITKDDF